MTQVLIIFSTGKYNLTQLISVLISLASLSWGGTRSFLIMRHAKTADPDPGLTTVWIWPYMLILTISKLFILVVIAGLSGVYIFPFLALSTLSTYGVLKNNQAVIYLSGISILTVQCLSVQIAGGYSFLLISIGVLLTYDGVLWLWRRNILRRQSSCVVDIERNLQEPSTMNAADLMEKELFYVMAAVCSTWIPSVVGDEKQRIFLKAGGRLKFDS